MSAFIVSDKHISALVSAGSLWGVKYFHSEMWRPIRGRENEIGQILLNENYRSVNYRYSEDEQPHHFRHVPSLMKYSLLQIIKACNCYNYQACETPDYYDTEAYSIVMAIREHAIHLLPGYEDAAWEIN